MTQIQSFKFFVLSYKSGLKDIFAFAKDDYCGDHLAQRYFSNITKTHRNTGERIVTKQTKGQKTSF